MPRRRTMTEYRDIIRRLRQNQGIRSIRKETGTHRTTIRKIRDVAKEMGWLLPENPLPTEKELYDQFSANKTVSPHPLQKYHDKIAEWIENKYSYVVIHKLISKNINCSESTVRRYIQKAFPVKVKAVMVRDTIPGEIMEVDFGYLGLTYDPKTQKRRKTYVFSGRLRHSRKAYRVCVFNQNQETFFECHVHAFEYFEGVPQKVVPDNLKAAVIKASYESPILNRVYQKLAEHYGFLISPCLPRKANHKGGVENDIKYIKTNFWPLFKEEQKEKGRDYPYSSELNAALNNWTREVAETRIIQGTGRTVPELFDEEKNDLKQLPIHRWDPLSWGEATVQPNWRIQFSKAFYSVPYSYIGEKVQILMDSKLVYIFHNHGEITIHEKAEYDWEYKRKSEHAPPEPEKYMSMTRGSLIRWAEQIGPETKKVVAAIFNHKSADGLRPARALIGLAKKYSKSRLEAACKRANHYDTPEYYSVKSILKNKLDLLELDDPVDHKGQRHFSFSREYGYFSGDENKNNEGESLCIN